MKTVLPIFCFLWLGIGFLRADDFGDTFPNDATHVSFDIAAWCNVVGHRFYFEKTPLSEIMHLLGGGRLQRTGDAGAAVFDYFVNYTNGRHLISFSSNSDMGGPEHDLQGIEIRDIRSTDHAAGLPHLKLPIEFPFGSSSISFAELTKKLGHPVDHHGVSAYIWSVTKTSPDWDGRMEPFETDSTLEIRAHNGKISDLEVYRVTSD